MLTFALRQLVVYLLIFALSLFVGRTSGPKIYATFTLFNFFFGLTYIVADLGYGKAVMRNGQTATPPYFWMASIFNLVLGCCIGVVAFFFFNTLQYKIEAGLVLLFFVATSASFTWFFSSESKLDFNALGKAEIAQVTIYAASFFVMYAVSQSATDALFMAVACRCISIPISYYSFSKNKINVASLDISGVKSVGRLFYIGFFHQASLVLFAIKDLILAYFIFASVHDEIKGAGFMSQTYMMMPLIVVNPVSRFLLPKLLRDARDTSIVAIGRISTIMAIYAFTSTALLFPFFPIFNSVFLHSKFNLSQHFLLYFACASIISIPALSIGSYLAANLGYQKYLRYALVCTCVTWIIGGLKIHLPGDDYGYPSAVLAGHAVNLGLILWFYLHRLKEGQKYAKSV